MARFENRGKLLYKKVGSNHITHSVPLKPFFCIRGTFSRGYGVKTMLSVVDSIDATIQVFEQEDAGLSHLPVSRTVEACTPEG